MLPTVEPAAVGLSRERLERVSDWLARQVDAQRLAGGSVLVGRRGKVAHLSTAGLADIEANKPFRRDTLVRIYSMTKAVTTVAAMTLHEQGVFQLDDPVAKYLPQFAHTPVWCGGSSPLNETRPQRQPISIRHLMTHTAGFTYGFMRSNVVDAAYRQADIEFPGGGGSLADQVDRLAQVPLLCQPGSAWNYSVSIDVLGRLIEIWSGVSLADYLTQTVFTPLAMHDTGFHVTAENHARFAALYVPKSGGDMSTIGQTATSDASTRGGLRLQESSANSHFLQPTTLYSGGGGLTGSIDDYARFCQMLLNGGELEGNRVLGRKTVEYMRLNQLPNNADMAAMGQPVWSETSYDGIGFGLGFAVVVDPVKAHIITSPGEHHWGGAASTFFWIDPAESLFCILFTQLMPSSTYPLRRDLRTAVYQALLD